MFENNHLYVCKIYNVNNINIMSVSYDIQKHILFLIKNIFSNVSCKIYYFHNIKKTIYSIGIYYNYTNLT